MKKKIISVITVFVTFLCVLFTPGLFNDSEIDYILLQNEELKDINEITTEESNPLYVLNLSTKKYHRNYCIYAMNISEENCYRTSSIEYISSRGYTKCSICFKQ